MTTKAILESFCHKHCREHFLIVKNSNYSHTFIWLHLWMTGKPRPNNFRKKGNVSKIRTDNQMTRKSIALVWSTCVRLLFYCFPLWFNLTNHFFFSLKTRYLEIFSFGLTSWELNSIIPERKGKGHQTHLGVYTPLKFILLRLMLVAQGQYLPSF